MVKNRSNSPPVPLNLWISCCTTCVCLEESSQLLLTPYLNRLHSCGNTVFTLACQVWFALHCLDWLLCDKIILSGWGSKGGKSSFVVLLLLSEYWTVFLKKGGKREKKESLWQKEEREDQHWLLLGERAFCWLNFIMNCKLFFPH